MSLAPHRPRGRRVAIVGDGGGTGVVTADLVTEADLELPSLSAELAAKLTDIAPSVITANPVDLAGAGEQDFWNFERVTSAVLASGEVDAVIFTGYFGGYSQMNETFSAVETEVGHAIARAADLSGRPLLTQAMYWASSPARALRAGGVPVYRDIEAVVDTLRSLVEQHEAMATGVPGCRRAAPQRSRAMGTSSRVSCSQQRACPLQPRAAQVRSTQLEPLLPSWATRSC